VIIDDLTSAMGTTALSGFIAISTQKEYSASQFALLSGLADLPKTIFGAAGGVIAESLGYPNFFLLCALLALPATVLVAKIQHHAENKGF
jgi:PAT family beta-lactamase induction signal transducer AmpG